MWIQFPVLSLLIKKEKETFTLLRNLGFLHTPWLLFCMFCRNSLLRNIGKKLDISLDGFIKLYKHLDWQLNNKDLKFFIINETKSTPCIWPVGTALLPSARSQEKQVREPTPPANRFNTYIPYPYPLTFWLKSFWSHLIGPLFFYITSHCHRSGLGNRNNFFIAEKRHVESRVKNRKRKTEVNSREMPDNFSLDVTWWRQQILRRLWCQRFLFYIKVKWVLSSSTIFPYLGPRWASWNLGIFLCIRCAGIHRNLGVHISRGGHNSNLQYVKFQTE